MNKKIIKFLLETGTINEDNVELYQYGLDLVIKKIIHVFLILLIAYIFNMFFSTLIFVITYMVIREYSGGFHAKTVVGCYLCTFTVTICLVMLLYIFQQLNSIWAWIVLLISGIIIWLFSPQETENKHLSVKERAVYQKKARAYLLFFIIAAILCCRNAIIVRGIVCSCFMQATMLTIEILGKLKNERHQKRIC